MGWQSYILYYNTEEEKQRIIDAIKAHNNTECKCPEHENDIPFHHWGFCDCDCDENATAEEHEAKINAYENSKNKVDCKCFDDVGEELEMVCWVKIHKPYKRGKGANCEYAILCGNGGGRHSTFGYFIKNRIRFEEYTSAFNNRANMEKAEKINI
tara:strand:+ start:306 stop:770 length:465 start_codon:yes stop_codon:yes gene_type:complete